MDIKRNVFYFIFICNKVLRKDMIIRRKKHLVTLIIGQRYVHGDKPLN